MLVKIGVNMLFNLVKGSAAIQNVTSWREQFLHLSSDEIETRNIIYNIDMNNLDLQNADIRCSDLHMLVSYLPLKLVMSL